MSLPVTRPLPTTTTPLVSRVFEPSTTASVTVLRLASPLNNSAGAEVEGCRSVRVRNAEPLLPLRVAKALPAPKVNVPVIIDEMPVLGRMSREALLLPVLLTTTFSA